VLPRDPNDPLPPRSELPEIARERRPVGWRQGFELEERLLGVGAFVLGVIGLGVVYGISSGRLPAGLPPPIPPPGILVNLPTLNAIACLLPLLTLFSIALIAIGLKRAFSP
jgi:hypothetical protein